MAKYLKPNIICSCGYRWFTKSKMKRVTCPSCRRFPANPNYKEKGEISGKENQG